MKNLRYLFSIKTNRIILATCVAASLFSAICLRAQTVIWTGGGVDHNWADTVNWNTGSLPPAADNIQLDTVAANNYAIYATAQGSSTYFNVKVGISASGRLDVTGGTLTSSTSNVRIGAGAAGSGFTGTLNIAGGTFNAGSILQVGLNNTSVGIVNVSSGVLDVNRGSTGTDGTVNDSINLGAGGTGQGTLNMSGGNIYTRFGVELGLSGGTGSGTFNVMGAGTALIGTANGANPTSPGFWTQQANGTLGATVTSGSWTLGQINLATVTGTTITFASGSTLSLGFSGAAPGSTMSWNLMTWNVADTTFVNNGLTLAAGDAAAGWSDAFVNNSGTEDLVITYTVAEVPEPSVLLLSGLGLVGALVVSRRRR